MHKPPKIERPTKRERLRQTFIIGVPLTLFGIFLYVLVALLHAALKMLPFDPLIVETISLGAVFITSLASGAVMLVVLQRRLHPRNKKKDD